MLKCNKGKCELKGKGAELLAEFSTLTKTLVKSGASKEDLEQAFKIGTGEIDLAAIKNKLSKEPEDNESMRTVDEEV